MLGHAVPQGPADRRELKAVTRLPSEKLTGIR
jgi:hypothetical protein